MIEYALVAIAAVLLALGAAFVVWVYRTDKALQKLVNDHQQRHYSIALRRGTIKN